MKYLKLHTLLCRLLILASLSSYGQHATDSLHSGKEQFEGFNTSVINYGNSGWIQFSPRFPRSKNVVFRFKESMKYVYDTNLVMKHDTSTISTLEYITGAGKNQFFHAELFRPLAEKVFLGASITRLSSEGYYTRSFVRQTIANVGVDYFALKEKLQGTIRVKYNTVDLEQNGGTTELLYYLSSDVPLKQTNTWNIALANAFTREVNAKASIEHSYLLAGTSDTLGNKKGVYIQQKASGWDYKFRYEDLVPDSAFYPKFTLFSPYFVNFRNKAFNYWINNEVGLAYDRNSDTIDYRIGFNLGHEIFQGRVQNRHFSGINSFLRLFGGLGVNGFNLAMDGKFIVDGYNRGDILFDAGAGKTIIPPDSGATTDKLRIDLKGYFDRRQIPFFVHDQVKQVLGTSSSPVQNNSQIMLEIASPAYYASIYGGLELHDNIYYPVLVDTTFSFKNYSYSAQFAGLSKHFQWGVFHLQTDHRFQFLFDAPFDFPNYTTINEIYYQGNWFKKALFLMVGLRGTYMTKYLGQGYLPFTDQFYGQGQYVFGNYPYIDFFVNARIKSAWVYFRMHHLNYNLIATDYFVAPGFYAAMPRRMSIGVKWDFLN